MSVNLLFTNMYCGTFYNVVYPPKKIAILGEINHKKIFILILIHEKREVIHQILVVE